MSNQVYIFHFQGMQPRMGQTCERQSIVAPAPYNQVISSSTADLLATSSPRSTSYSVLSSSSCNRRDNSHESTSSNEAEEQELQGLLLYLKQHFSGTG